MIADRRPDGLIIATPDEMHVAQGLASVAAVKEAAATGQMVSVV